MYSSRLNGAAGISSVTVCFDSGGSPSLVDLGSVAS